MISSYQEGHKAYRNGQSLGDNPYDKLDNDDRPMYFPLVNWAQGWMDAERGVDREEIDENH